MKTIVMLSALLFVSCSDNLYKVGKCYTAHPELGRMSRIIAIDQVSTYTLFNDGVEKDASFVIWLKYYSDQAQIVECSEKVVPNEDAKQKVKDICARAKAEKLKYDKAFCAKFGG